MRAQGFPNTSLAAARGIRQRQLEQVVFAVVAGHNEEQPSTRTELRSDTSQSVATTPSSFNWPALAICETGGDVHMTGSTYSSMYGVLNQAIRENAPPDVAERILNGTASVEEQTAMAIELERKHGIKAWACWEAAVG